MLLGKSWNCQKLKKLKVEHEKLSLSEVEKVKSWKLPELKMLKWKNFRVENVNVESVKSWNYKSWKGKVENAKLKMQKLNHHAAVFISMHFW